MARTLLALCIAAFLVAPLAAPLAAGRPGAVADLFDVTGRPVGKVTFRAVRGGARFTAVVKGLEPGAHGIHVHAVGLCEGPDYKSAGGHFNPTGRKHGLQNPEGHHAGDVPNLVVGAAGKGKVTATLPGATLGTGPDSLFHEGGTAVVIHADRDDGRSDPAGNSGARIACGTIRRP
jgi:Cu-Zn family superoxide dismutase